MDLNREPVVLVSDQLSLDAARAGAVAGAGRPDLIIDDPEHWWPSDRSWVVNRDFDLDELYIACDDELASSLMADLDLEVVEVGLKSRVDWAIDDDRRGPSFT